MTARTRAGAIAWIATLQFFVVETFAAIGWPGYSAIADRISDLGAARSPLHDLTNASLIVQGMLIAGGALLLRERFPPGRLRTTGLAFVALNGLGVLVVGIVPEDSNRLVHDLGAVALFLAGNAGMLLLGPSLLHASSRLRPLGAAAVALGTIGALGAAIFIVRWFGTGAIGAFEHLAVDPLPLWLMLAGWTYITRTTPIMP